MRRWRLAESGGSIVAALPGLHTHREATWLEDPTTDRSTHGIRRRIGLWSNVKATRTRCARCAWSTRAWQSAVAAREMATLLCGGTLKRIDWCICHDLIGPCATYGESRKRLISPYNSHAITFCEPNFSSNVYYCTMHALHALWCRHCVRRRRGGNVVNVVPNIGGTWPRSIRQRPVTMV